jgi:hypothetical protein
MVKVRFILFVLSLIFLAGSGAFALGQQEDVRILQVKELLDQRKLSDAEKLLLEIIRSNPSQIDNIRSISDRIRVLRAEYNQKLKKFMELLHEGNEEFIYSTIKELEALDNSPSALGRAILSQAKENAWVAINLKKFFDIMDKAELSLNAGAYSEAMNIYPEVFGLHKTDFYENKEYGDILKNNIQTISVDIARLMKQFQELNSKLEKDKNDFYLVLPAASEKKLTEEARALRSELNGLLSIHLLVEKSAVKIKQINESIKRNFKKAKGDYHLYYLYRVIYGRDFEGRSEGILYTIERQWETYLQDIEKIWNQAADPLFINAKKQFLNYQYGEADDNFTRAYLLYLWELKYSSLWTWVVVDKESNILIIPEWERIKIKTPAYLQTQEKAKEARTYLKLISYYEQKDKYAKQPPLTDEKLDSYRAEIKTTIVEIQGLNKTWQDQVVYLDNINKKGYAINDISYSAREMLARVDVVYNAYKDLDKNAVRTMLQARVNIFSSTLTDNDQKSKEAIKLRDDKKQPTKALALLEEVDGNFKSLINDIDNFSSKWKQAGTYIAEDKTIQETVQNAEDIKQKTAGLKDKLQAEIDVARKQSYEANQHKNKGLAEYEKSRRSFERNQFSMAKDQLKTAYEELTESLRYEEDPEIRRLVDKDLIAFDKEIMEKWKNQSIIEVRNLINQAQEAFRQQLFINAESLLLKAQKLQNEIDPANPDMEIVIWLEIVRGALSARSSREIKEEETNYPEMTQLFNLANKDYYDGLQELKKGNNEQGNKLFTKAKEKIDLIKRSYPYHRDSRVLIYKIEQATKSRDEFNQYLAVQVRNADQFLEKRNYLEAYAIYQDVQEVNPRYPGINEKVKSAEELIGMRLRTPSAENIAEANELLRLAKISFDQKDYQVARGYLNNALRLNPVNREAATLKDRINEILSPYSSILPVEAQRLYNAAVVYYNNKEYLNARLKIEELKRNFPEQVKNTKVVELEEKIKSRIGS